MAVFELILGLLLGGVVLSVFAPRLGMPWPALLALAGAGLAFVPGGPKVVLDPELALALFVAPVLLDAAFDTSPRDLRANWMPVGGLVLGAVGATTIAVAFVARWLEPSLPWAAAITLGAIVAPPDAAAATAVLRQVKLPHRLVVILEGESLLNDASALLLYRFAVSMVAGGLTIWTAPLLALAAVGGVVLGFVLARLSMAITSRVEDGPAADVLGFLFTFGVWLLAEAVQVSAVLTMVAFAVTIARTAPSRMGARRRRSNYAVWDVAVFVLNVLAFVLVGLQLRDILVSLDGKVGSSALFAAWILVTVIVVRVAWVMAYHVAAEGVDHLRGRSSPPRTVQSGLVIAWSGMRGIVTLAAALALPFDFPGRALILLAAFVVVLGTLVLQGLTLRPLLARVVLPPDESVEEEVTLARAEAAQAALDALEGATETHDEHAHRLLAQKYRARLEPAPRPGELIPDPTGMASLRRRALAAERARLTQLRREERIGDDAFHRVEEELDWAEASVDGGNS